jgi:hypothetical protein
MQQENPDMMLLPAKDRHEEAGEDASIAEGFSIVSESA